MAKFHKDPRSPLWKSTVTAAGGLFSAVRTEKKVRQVVLAGVSAVAVCVVWGVGYYYLLLVIFSWVVSLICELFNTALEKAMDYTSGKEYHVLIRQGKDYAAACTFAALVFAGCLTLFVLYQSTGARLPVEQCP